MKTLFASLLVLATFTINAQLEDGSIAPDFTLTDINGTEHHLYEYLDMGKTVFIDFFAAHCPSCWSYHNQHHIENLNVMHGPDGSSTQDVIVLAIEHDANNGTDELFGISGNTQGNWIEGTTYPFINPEGKVRTEILDNYDVLFYPMVYSICPDRTITYTGTQSTNMLYANVGECEIVNSIDDRVTANTSILTFDPSNFILTVTNAALQSKLEGFDVMGRLVLTTFINSEIDMFSIEAAGGGAVVIRVTSPAGEVFQKKFLTK